MRSPKRYLALGLLAAVAGLSSCAGQARPERYKSATGLEFVLVRAGSFTMGESTSESFAYPEHEVTLTRDYYIGTTEVTFDAYDRFVEETGARQGSDFRRGRGQRPAVDMVWLDAVLFCNWLSQKDGLRPAYQVDGDRVTWVMDSDGYRLPTEAEWEYAAEGGPLLESHRYSGSNDPSEVAWYRDNSGLQSQPVASKRPNGLGLFDMTGNVAEYCWDWSERFDASGKDVEDPVGPTTGTIRSVRGGSHTSPALNLSTTYRAGSFLADRSGSKGFRVARTAPPATGTRG